MSFMTMENGPIETLVVQQIYTNLMWISSLETTELFFTFIDHQWKLIR